MCTLPTASIRSIDKVIAEGHVTMELDKFKKCSGELYCTNNGEWMGARYYMGPIFLINVGIFKTN